MWGENRAWDCRAAVRSAAALLRASFYSVLGEWAASRFLRCACAIYFPCSSPAEDLSSSRLLGFFYSCSCCSSKTARSLALFLLFCRSELFTPCLRYPSLLLLFYTCSSVQNFQSGHHIPNIRPRPRISIFFLLSLDPIEKRKDRFSIAETFATPKPESFSTCRGGYKFRRTANPCTKILRSEILAAFEQSLVCRILASFYYRRQTIAS
jgi:hypothetical protein